MSRPPKHDAATIGAELIDARAAGVPWKSLERRWGLGRFRLWQLWRAALDATDATWPALD